MKKVMTAVVLLALTTPAYAQLVLEDTFKRGCDHSCLARQAVEESERRSEQLEIQQQLDRQQEQLDRQQQDMEFERQQKRLRWK